MPNTFIIDTFKHFNISAITPEEVHAMAKTLGLEYVHENETEAGVCFANISGLRPEFRQAFTISHLDNYIRAMMKSGLCKPVNGSTLVSIPFPADAESFWKLAEENR
jgi:hypothetical protein